MVSTSPTICGFELTHNLYDSYKSGSLATIFDIFFFLFKYAQISNFALNSNLRFDVVDNKLYNRNKNATFLHILFLLVVISIGNMIKCRRVVRNGMNRRNYFNNIHKYSAFLLFDR